MPTFSDNPQDTPGRILYAALQLFAEKGFDTVSVREICAAAGVSKPVLYYHFENRDGVIRAVLRKLEEGWRHHCSATLDQQPPSREALVDFFTGLIAIASNDGIVSRIMARMPTAPVAILRETADPRQYDGVLTSWLQAGVDSGTFHRDLDTRAVAGLLLGAFTRTVALRTIFPADPAQPCMASYVARLVDAALGLPQRPAATAPGAAAPQDVPGPTAQEP